MTAEEIQLIMLSECVPKHFNMKGADNAPNFFEGC